jgi:hypothetical protein
MSRTDTIWRFETKRRGCEACSTLPVVFDVCWAIGALTLLPHFQHYQTFCAGSSPVFAYRRYSAPDRVDTSFMTLWLRGLSHLTDTALHGVDITCRSDCRLATASIDIPSSGINSSAIVVVDVVAVITITIVTTMLWWRWWWWKRKRISRLPDQRTLTARCWVCCCCFCASAAAAAARYDIFLNTHCMCVCVCMCVWFFCIAMLRDCVCWWWWTKSVCALLLCFAWATVLCMSDPVHTIV